MAGGGGGSTLAHRGAQAEGIDWAPDQVQSGTIAGSASEAMAGPLARGLGWFSLGLGLVQLLAPDQLARTIGAPVSPRTRVITRAMGLRELAHGVGILSSDKPTGWMWSRVGGDALDLGLLGAAALAEGADRERLAATAALVAGTAAADVFDSVQLSQSPAQTTTFVVPMRVKAAVTIESSTDDLFRFWRNLENLPQFMGHVESVTRLDETTWRWRVSSPVGDSVTWDAEIIDEVAGELIAWRSLPGSDITNSGIVRFRPAPGDRGSEVHVDLTYHAPGGPLGAALAKIVGEDPVQQVKDDLRRFKQIVETGQIVRSEGALQGMSAKFQPKQHPAQPKGESA